MNEEFKDIVNEYLKDVKFCSNLYLFMKDFKLLDKAKKNENFWINVINKKPEYIEQININILYKNSF